MRLLLANARSRLLKVLTGSTSLMRRNRVQHWAYRVRDCRPSIAVAKSGCTVEGDPNINRFCRNAVVTAGWLTWSIKERRIPFSSEPKWRANGFAFSRSSSASPGIRSLGTVGSLMLVSASERRHRIALTGFSLKGCPVHVTLAILAVGSAGSNRGAPDTSRFKRTLLHHKHSRIPVIALE